MTSGVKNFNPVFAIIGIKRRHMAAVKNFKIAVINIPLAILSNQTINQQQDKIK